MGAVTVLYAVVSREGKGKLRKNRLRKNRHRSPMIYEKRSTAQAQCREGDAVVELFLDLGRAPLYIRGEVL